MVIETADQQVSVEPDTALQEAIVRTASYDVMYRQSRTAQAINVTASALLVYGLWGVTNSALLVTWWLVLAAFSAFRLGLSLAYFRRTTDDRSGHIWQRLFNATLIATSLAWGIGSLFIMPDVPLYRMMVFAFLVGLAGGATTSYAAHPPIAIASVICLLVPATIAFALNDQLAFKIVALGAALYIAGLARGASRISAFVGHSLELSHNLEQARLDAESRAMTDELTGLSNHGAFYELGRQALRLARQYERPLAAIVIDLDHFKRINDQYGHAAGDNALRLVAEIILETRRDADIAGRLGGDEFAILLPETAADIVNAMAESLRRDIQNHPPIAEINRNITCSLGVAVEYKPESLEALLGRADQALYRAKSRGRNRIETEDLPVGPETSWRPAEQ